MKTIISLFLLLSLTLTTLKAAEYQSAIGVKGSLPFKLGSTTGIDGMFSGDVNYNWGAAAIVSNDFKFNQQIHLVINTSYEYGSIYLKRKNLFKDKVNTETGAEYDYDYLYHSLKVNPALNFYKSSFYFSIGAFYDYYFNLPKTIKIIPIGLTLGLGLKINNIKIELNFETPKLIEIEATLSKKFSNLNLSILYIF